MTLAQAWVDRTRLFLLNGYVGERNKLAAPYTAGSGSLSFTYPLGGIAAGSRLSIGLNTFYVWAITGATATVSGGEEGTTDVNAASGATVKVRPRFTDSEILTSLNEELASLSSPQSGLYQVKTFDVTYSPTIDGYDLTGLTDVQSVFKVEYQEPGPFKDWPEIPSYEWRMLRTELAADFPSGNAIRITQAGWPGYDIRLHYKAPFTLLTDLTTDVSLTGVATQAYDIPPLGAAIRMVAGREIKRNFTEAQPDTRRASEVPPGAVLNSSRGLQLLYAQRVAAETSRLQALWPYKMD